MEEENELKPKSLAPWHERPSEQPPQLGSRLYHRSEDNGSWRLGDQYGNALGALSQSSDESLMGDAALSGDVALWELIKGKFVGYFRWTVFAMLLAPLALWIASRP